MLNEFKEFAMKGNVIDLAVGVVIGGAFGKIVTALVDSIIMPVVGMLIGGVDFSDLAITLKEATEEAEAVTIGYGAFLNTILEFLIIAFAIFLVIKQINRLKREEPVDDTPAEPSEDIKLLTEIRDSLTSL